MEASPGRVARLFVVFVFDLAPTPGRPPQNPQSSNWTEYGVAGGDVHDRSTGPFRPNPRWLAWAFAHLVRTPRGHCAPLQFLIGGAPTRPPPRGPNAEALTEGHSKTERRSFGAGALFSHWWAPPGRLPEK